MILKLGKGIRKGTGRGSPHPAVHEQRPAARKGSPLAVPDHSIANP